MVTNQPCTKPFAAEAVAIHKLNNQRVEVSVQVGKDNYSLLVSGNVLYIYNSQNELLETYLV